MISFSGGLWRDRVSPLRCFPILGHLESSVRYQTDRVYLLSIGICDRRQTVWIRGFVGDGGDLRANRHVPERERTASLAHEINNPLDALIHIIYLVQTEPSLSENGRRYLQLAREELDRLATLVRETLHQSPDAGERRQTNIPALLQGILALYKSRFEAKEITVNRRYCNDGSISAFSDRLHGAFSNILLNAADAVSPGGRIEVRVRQGREWSEQGRSGLRITIADNGSGIRGGDLPKVLQPCFSTKGARGSGMGLVIANDAVSRHDGVLRIRSTTRPGRSGCVFAMFLPGP